MVDFGFDISRHCGKVRGKKNLIAALILKFIGRKLGLNKRWGSNLRKVLRAIIHISNFDFIYDNLNNK